MFNFILQSAFLFFIVLLYLPVPKWLMQTGQILAIVGVGLLSVLIVLVLAGHSILNFVEQRFNWFKRNNLRAKLIATSHKFIDGLSSLREWQSVVGFLLISSLVWIAELLIMVFMAETFRINVSPFGLLFVLLTTALGTIIPSSPGFVGTYEFFSTTALGLLGVESGVALGFSIATHSVLLVSSVAIGAVCLSISGVSIVKKKAWENS